MASLCRARINNGGDTNYHIFLNSVKGISRIIRLANLVPDDVRVVCSKSNGKKNESILPAGFTIASTTDPVKPINFYTSTCFEGQDIYDKNGRTFIVSDGFTDHTKIDISTSFIQICGRIRDSQYKGQVTQVYAISRYKDVSLEEFAASVKKDIVDAEHDVALLGQLSERRRKNWLNKIEKGGDRFIFVDGDQAKVDHNMAKLEIVNYKIVNGIYRSFYNMTQELKRVGFAIDGCRELEVETLVTQSPSASKSTFKDAFEEYCQIMESKPHFCFTANPRQERIEFDKPLVKEAYQKLGAEEVRKLNYRQKDIKRALIVKSKETENVKIVKMVNASLPKQTAVPAKKVKELLQGIYEELGICCTAKATDLKKWYDIKKSSVRIDGITTSCVTIIRPLINIGI